MKCLRTCLTLMLLSAAYPLTMSCARAEPHNLVGQWQVKFTFSGEEEHSLRFEAQAGGSGQHSCCSICRNRVLLPAR